MHKFHTGVFLNILMCIIPNRNQQLLLPLERLKSSVWTFSPITYASSILTRRPFVFAIGDIANES